jgi:hypothetical protein
VKNVLWNRLLRATFYILRKQPAEAMADLNQLINNNNASTTDVKIKANALIKRATLYIQQCKAGGLRDNIFRFIANSKFIPPPPSRLATNVGK